MIETPPADIRSRCRFWDCAATPEGGDWTVGVRIARTVSDQYVVEHVVRGQWSAAEVDRIIRQTADTDGGGVRIREEQEPGSAGKAVIVARTRLLAGFDYRGVLATGEKTTRWRPLAAQAEAGNVQLVRGAWNAAWLDELEAVPFGTHDDQADAAAGAFAACCRHVKGHREVAAAGSAVILPTTWTWDTAVPHALTTASRSLMKNPADGG